MPLLQYQVFQNNVPDGQQFWINPNSNGPLCQTVDTNGHIGENLCILSFPALCTNSGNSTTVPTFQTTVSSQGLSITGFRDNRSFRFQGIPFANPPARWTYPAAYTGSKAINATTFGSQCIQAGQTTGSEDCLFLNIWTPFVPSPSPAPKSSLKAVMFWIHGGAFTSGTGADPTFDGGPMASRGDVIIVTTNYRLSTLGFLALDDGQTNGNYGIADQIAALEWVNQHISAFGGDPDRITIFGQSAGAGSVRALLQSPKAIGNFAAAIQMSNLVGLGYAMTYSQYYTIAQEQTLVADPILAATNCSTAADRLACLKAVDGFTLVNLPTVARFVVADGTFVPQTQLPLNQTGKIADVHAVIGWMRDDGAAFIGTPTNDNAAQALEAAGLPTALANNSLFPIPSNEATDIDDLFNMTARGATDGMFRCLDQATAFSGVQHNLFKSVWTYEFNRSYQTPGFDPNAPKCDAPVDVAHPAGNPDAEYFKCHSGELFFVFGSLPTSLPYRDANDLPFMQVTMDTWTSFARTFDPNPDPAFLKARGFTTSAARLALQPQWEPVTKSNLNGTPLRILEVPSKMNGFRELAQCDFLDFSLNHFG
ncbi:uncharacterized protein PHACADRAFT_252144 [Phanerochaete carnosa HHB-10118-sp]|uniref:Carboxylic ester hydrolase n=1 Tax=Phanerochaete carnosa (strain HHB-10118-sp) TaxID=650164 RepID=K5X5G6_PHACS|nr:uncharacterized protein PHACADRAFT_252144 [Phanerochaete carnosa HHB-10118-sp]EKM58107.1 hypothetical protein PHACADRAFT_252144 [Phanerochaete carnosa HHB-10118-sp]